MRERSELGAAGTVVLVVVVGAILSFVVIGGLGIRLSPAAWWGVALVPGAFVADRLLLAAEDRGWIYWRRRSASATGLGTAMLAVQAIFEPDKEHVVEERLRAHADIAGDEDPPDLTFRRLTDDDLPLLHAWLNEPGVVRWWEGDDVSWDAVVRDYGSASTDPTEYWLALAGDRPVGWIQCYLAADYAGEDEPEAWFALGLPRTTGGIDYLVAGPEARGRGLGSTMIRAFVDGIVLPRHPGWTHLAASPQAANVASWRALEKAGFAAVGEFDSDHGRCRLMVTERAARPGA